MILPDDEKGLKDEVNVLVDGRGKNDRPDSVNGEAEEPVADGLAF